MTDKTDLIREIHEYVTTHGGENTATHLLVQAASAIQTHATAATAAAEQLRRIKSTACIMQYAPDSQAMRDSLSSLCHRAFEALKVLETTRATAPQPAPAPLSDDAKDAARWRMVVLIGNEVMLHPEKRTHATAVEAYMDATHSGSDLTEAVDAAIAAQGGKA